MEEQTTRYPQYRWLILGLAWLVLTGVAWSWFLIPSLAYALIPEFDLTIEQFTLILTAPLMIGMFIPIPGGALGDRFGIRVIVSVVAFLAGILGISRIFFPDFMGMFILMCLYSIPLGIIMPNLPKLVSIWFPPNEAGLASGIYMTGLNIGVSLGLLTGPLFGGWQSAFLTIGIFMLVVAVLWTLFAKDAPEGIEMPKTPIKTGIIKGIKSKNVWLIALGQFLFLGGFMGFSGNLPVALESIHHVDPKTAGAIASCLAWGVTFGNFFIPLLSDKVGLRKPFIYFGAITTAIFFYFSWYLAPEFGIWILISLGGFIFGSVQPLLFTVLIELPELDPESLGGASGIVSSLLLAGGFLVPLLIVSPVISKYSFTTGFLVTELIIAAIALPALLLIETGQKKKV